MNFTLDQLKNMNSQDSSKFGLHLFNLGTGTIPEIDTECGGLSGTLDCIQKITIEKAVFTSHDVMILTGGHDPYKFGTERCLSDISEPIHICEGAWIASRAIILKGVTLGKYAVIGAGSVVTCDVPEYELWAGNPAKFIKKLL